MSINVAPSFKEYKLIGKPFLKKGKQYMRALNPSSGKERDIRIYTDSEFRKLYPDNSNSTSSCSTANAPFPMMKHARGFDNGPILVIRNEREEDEPWLRQSVARYAVDIGWYIVSEEVLPDDAPPHFKYLLLSFDEFKDGDDYHKKTPAQLEKILKDKIKKGEWFNING